MHTHITKILTLLLALALCLSATASADPLTLDPASPTPKITTPGGCTITVEGSTDAAWTIDAPAGRTRIALNGKSVFVTQADGSSWKVPGSMSFILPDGTKITLGMKMDRQNGLVPENLHIAHGNDDVIVSGLSKNKLKSSASQTRPENESRFADGDYAILDTSGAFFLLTSNQVADAQAGKSILALTIFNHGDSQFDTKPSPNPLTIPPAALPLLTLPDPE